MRILIASAVLAAAVAATSAGAHTSVPALPPTSDLVAAKKHFLDVAERGVERARTLWWNERLGWYDESLYSHWHQPLLMLWSAYQLFNAVNGVALADPSPANIRAVRKFANGAEAYFNPAVKPGGAYAYYPHYTDTAIRYYFDDNGWFGIAYMDAYRVTHDRRYLQDALKAFRFLDRAGWDAKRGGFWWDTYHEHKTSEPLAAAILIGVRIYEATHDRSYLHKALRWLAWAHAHSWNRRRGLYQRSATDNLVMSYVEGLMAAANAEACAVTRQRSYCRRAELVARNAVRAFGVNLHWSPRYDAVYLYGLLNLYARDHASSWYALTYHNALRALSTQNDRGLFLLSWSGEQKGDDTRLKDLGLDAASLSVFAWLAASRLPT